MAPPGRTFIDRYERQTGGARGSSSVLTLEELDERTTQARNNNPGKPDRAKPQKQTHYSFTSAAEYPSHYYLELYEDPKGAPVDSILCPYVNGLQMSQPLAVQRTWTFSGEPYEEHSGFQQRTFSISGRSGYSFTALSRFAKFRNFLEKYARLSAENKNALERLKDVRLALNFPWEGEAYWCTLISFQYQRSTTTSRISFEYQLVLVTNGVAAQRWDPNGALGYSNCDKGDGCHLDPSHFCHRRARQELMLAPSDVQDVIGSRDRSMTKLLDDSERGADRGMRGGPFDQGYYQDLWQGSDDNFNAVYFRYLTLDPPERAAARLSVVVVCRWLVDLRIQCEIELGSRGIRADERSSQPTSTGGERPRPVADRGQLVGMVSISSGERTAHDVAQRYLGDRALWLEIVRLNSMMDARTKNDGTPLLPKDQLKIPFAGGVQNIGDVYGTSVLIRDGDLVVEGDESTAMVSGIDNFYQNLRHRMTTIKGANRAYPQYGLPELVGTVDTTDVPGQILTNVRLQALADHRVKELTEMSLQEEADKITVDFSVTTVAGDDRKMSYVKSL